MIAMAVLGVFSAALFWRDRDDRGAVTPAFVTLALAQLWHVFNIRGAETPPLRNAITRNPFV